MASAGNENKYTQQILQTIALGEPVTQRSLSSELGVALGLTNLLMRRLISKGYVRMAGMGTRHVRYLMTAAGWEALGRATRQSLENTLNLYTQTREQIRASLARVSETCPADAEGAKRVVFYGAGDVAEIAFVSLQSTDLTLVGVIDDHRTGLFFGISIFSSDLLTADALDGRAYDRVIVTSTRQTDAIRARLDACGVPARKTAWLQDVAAATRDRASA